jgi:hypothetical protein
MNKPAGFLDQGQERAGGSGIIKNRKLSKVVFSFNWLTLLYFYCLFFGIGLLKKNYTFIPVVAVESIF